MSIPPASISVGLMLFGAMSVALPAKASASELVTLKNGFDLVSDHRENIGDRVRLYTTPGSSNFVEFATPEIASIQSLQGQPSPGLTEHPDAVITDSLSAKTNKPLTLSELHQMLTTAGARHNIDADLLASVVRAESGGNAHAVSRAGARGLMQLMPWTAAQLGVTDSFRPEENIRGGTAYLNTLLVQYHDNLAFALAAYNAGPAAVARWHGVPPYRETRAYVARIIREFNARRPAATHPGTPALPAKATQKQAQLLASR